MNDIKWPEEILETHGFVLQREVAKGNRFQSEKLNGMMVDVWETGTWSHVGKNVYGAGKPDLQQYLEKED